MRRYEEEWARNNLPSLVQSWHKLDEAGRRQLINILLNSQESLDAIGPEARGKRISDMIDTLSDMTPDMRPHIHSSRHSRPVRGDLRDNAEGLAQFPSGEPQAEDRCVPQLGYAG